MEAETFTVHVKRGGETLEISVPASGTVGDLQQRLDKFVAVRQQKLMCKGKVKRAHLSEGSPCPTNPTGRTTHHPEHRSCRLTLGSRSRRLAWVPRPS
jgi:hypothetical protein